jgi:hypothetical protein
MVDGCVPFDLNFEEAKFSSMYSTDIHILHLDLQRWYYELLLHAEIYVVSDNIPDRNMGICVDDMHNC